MIPPTLPFFGCADAKKMFLYNNAQVIEFFFQSQIEDVL